MTGGRGVHLVRSRGRKVPAVVVALVAAMLMAGCAEGQAEQAGREVSHHLSNEASNFTETNRSLMSRASERWDWDSHKNSEGSSTSTTVEENSSRDQRVRAWSPAQVRARLTPVVGTERIATVKPQDFSRARLKLPDGREVADVVLWDKPATNTTYVLVRAQIPAEFARPHATVQLRVHHNDDVTNGHGCQGDAQQPPEQWFASVDDVWEQGRLPVMRLDADRRASPMWAVTTLNRDAVEGKALVLYGQPGVKKNVGSSTRIACAVVGAF